MAKYSFKVYLEDGSSKIVVPNEMVNTDLHDMDKFVEMQKGYINLCGTLAKQLDIETNLIKKITILRNRKGVEFSLANNNQYLAPVLDCLLLKKIQGDKNYQIETMTVSTSNPNYVEMRKYLFDNIRADYAFFLKEVYPYNNEFSNLLNRYGTMYNQGIYSEEDEREIMHLESIIGLELSIYKNYRGLCRSRKKYEEKVNAQVMAKRNRRKQTNLKVAKTMNNNLNYTLVEELPDIKQLTYIYNQEYEEFLDEDEYINMAGGNEVFKGYK